MLLDGINLANVISSFPSASQYSAKLSRVEGKKARRFIGLSPWPSLTQFRRNIKTGFNGFLMDGLARW